MDWNIVYFCCHWYSAALCQGKSYGFSKAQDMSLRLCLFAYYFFAPWGNLKARCYALDWCSHFSLMRELHGINSEAEKRGKIIFLLTFLKLTYHYIGSKLSFIFKEFLSETVSETDAFPFIIKCLSRPSSLPFSLPSLPFTQCSSSSFFFPT